MVLTEAVVDNGLGLHSGALSLDQAQSLGKVSASVYRF
jgi:hypothetical protein